MEEGPAVLCVGSSVDLHHRRVHAVRGEVLRFQDPPFQAPAIGGLEVLLLRLGHEPVVKPRIEVGDPRLGALGEHVELAGGPRVGGAERDHARSDIEVVDPAPAARLLAKIAVEVDRLDGGDARPAGGEEDPVPLRRPHDPGRMPGAHVVDHAVVHRLVEVGGEAARTAAGEGHHPQPLEQADVEAVRGDEGDQVALRGPDRRAQIEAAAEPYPIGLDVDEVEVQLPLKVGPRLRVAGDDEAGAVGRPVEVGDVPRAVGELPGIAACRRHTEEVVVATVDVTPAVVLVVETAHDPGDRRSPDLLTALRRPRVVDHRVGVREHGAEESDAFTVWRPLRHAHAVRNRAELPRRSAGGDIEREQLIDRAHPAHERDAAAVGRPLRRVVAKDAGGRLHRLRVEQPADDDTTSILPGSRVCPAHLVGDTLAVRTEADVVDPAETVEVFGGDRGGHSDPRMLPAADCAVASRCKAIDMIRWYNLSR